MNDLRKQCINLMTQRIIDNTFEDGDPSAVIAHLLIFGKEYCFDSQYTDDLINMVWEEFRHQFEEDELDNPDRDDVPDRPRFEAWLMKQDVKNWYANR